MQFNLTVSHTQLGIVFSALLLAQSFSGLILENLKNKVCSYLHIDGSYCYEPTFDKDMTTEFFHSWFLGCFLVFYCAAHSYDLRNNIA